MNKNMLHPIIAAVVTTVVYFATKSLWHMWLGPMLIIFFTAWSLLVSISNKWKFNRLGLLPFLISIYFFFQGLATIWAFVADYMGSEHELPISTYALVSTGMSGISWSLKALPWGFGLSLALYTICICVAACQKKPIE